ncbi:MAG TPA: glycosyltransferase family 2 protein [Bryobacterales bacterium]|nr:glycosyltransferase family 2 protein [Bryobacterales bacterium]
MADHTPELSVIIPCFNEEAVLPLLRERLSAALDQLGVSWEVVFVDDGSTDRTPVMLCDLHRRDPRCKLIGLSRNFGHQTAISAGLSYASGNAVAIMDADLQDPPELLGACLEKWREGYEVVFAIRRKRKEGLLKRAAYGFFYRLLKAIADIDVPLDSGDFCLMDRRAADVLRSMPERNIFVRGMRAWAGFRQVGIPYERDARAAGNTKYPFRKLLRLALDGIFSFSTFPLRLATWFGLVIVALSMLVVIFVLIWRFSGFAFMGHAAADIPGWAAGIVSVFFLGGVQLLILGVLGEYLARIYAEVKLRPRWVVSRSLGFDRGPGQVE